MIATELAVRAMRWHGAFTHWVGAFRLNISHLTPPGPHSTTSTLSSTHSFRPRRVSSCPCRVRIRDRRRGPGPGALPEDLARTRARVGRRIERWYARAQHVVSTEDLWIQPLRSNLTPVGFARRLTFELRLEWDAVAAGAGGVPMARVSRSSCRGVRGDGSGLMRRRAKCYGWTTSLLEHSRSASRAIMRGGRGALEGH